MTFQFDKVSAAAYLAAMIDGEGHVGSKPDDPRRRCIEIANTERDIIDATLEACRILLIRARLSRRAKLQNGRKEAFIIRIGELDNLIRVRELVPLQSTRKRLALDAQLAAYTKRPILPLREVLIADYESGLSANEIGQKYGVECHIILRKLRKAGVLMRTKVEADRLRWQLHPAQPRTHCVHGHLLDEKNLYTYKGRRRCRACRRVAYHRPKGAAA